MRPITGWFAAIASVGILAHAAGAQSTTVRSALAGEWTGTLVLDNSSPRVSVEFSVTDTSITGNVYSDGSTLGPIENATLRGDTVHFTVGRLDFTGRLNGTSMKVALIVYNGSTRNLTLTKTPEFKPLRLSHAPARRDDDSGHPHAPGVRRIERAGRCDRIRLARVDRRGFRGGDRAPPDPVMAVGATGLSTAA